VTTEDGRAGDHDLSIIGSGISAGGKVELKASDDITIAAVEDSSMLDASWKSGRTKNHGHFETETTVGSSISGGDSIATTSGGDTLVSASKLQAGSDGHSADLTMKAGGDLLIASGKDTTTTEVDSKRKGFLSKKSSHRESYDETTVGSELGASGNVNLNADGNAVIAGSKVTAGGSLAVEADSVSVIGAEEQHQLESESKKSGLFAGSGDGFISLWGKEQKDKNQASELNVASALTSGTDVTLKARETDVNVIGSTVKAGQDITLDAARDVNITPGAESSSASEQEKRSGFGIAYSSGNGSASIGIGYGKSVDQTAQSAETNATSTLSAGRDITISAGRDTNLQAATVEAERDVAIQAERDVNLLSAQDKSNYEHLHEEFFAGISLSVSTSLVSAADSVSGAAQKIANISDGYSAANAAFASLKAYDALDKIAKGGNVASGSLTVGFTYQKEKEAAQSSVPALTDIRAGQSVTIQAVSGDLTSHGAQIAAGYDADGQVVVSDNDKAGDITLKAGKDIILESAEATNNSSTTSTSGGASFGVSAGVGIKGVSGGLTGSANASAGKSSADGTTQVNSHVNGTGDIALESGNDTRLAGAVVSGDTVTADVGGASQASAAAAATTTALASLFLIASAGPAGAAIDQKTTLKDGTVVHVTGQQDELIRNVVVTLPTGQDVSLVLTTTGDGKFELLSGNVLGGSMPASMLYDLANQLSSGGVSVVYNEKATPGKPEVEEGKQGKHVPGHNNHTPGRSELNDPDPQKLINDHAGTGQQVGNVPVGQPGSKERINFGKVIGSYVDPLTGEKIPTTKGIIHYGSKGVHIVPSRP